MTERTERLIDAIGNALPIVAGLISGGGTLALVVYYAITF